MVTTGAIPVSPFLSCAVPVGTSALGWSWRPCAPHCGPNPQTDEVRPAGSPAGSAWRQADARIRPEAACAGAHGTFSTAP